MTDPMNRQSAEMAAAVDYAAPGSLSGKPPRRKGKGLFGTSIGVGIRTFLASPQSAMSVAWATSVVFHVVLFTTVIILVPPLARVFRDTSKEQVIIPNTALASDSDVGGIPNPGMGKDPSRNAAQENDSSVSDTHGWAERRSADLAQALNGSALGSGDDIAQGDEKNKGGGKDNAVFSMFSGGGGQMGTFGPRGGGNGVGPRSKIFGHGSNVRSIIYICDGSGSLVGDKDNVLKNEMKTDVSNLAPIQAFNVLIFQENKDGTEFSALNADMTMASPTNQTKLFDYLEHKIEFRGTTNPVPALEEAFREKPQLIFLLTDGDFDNPSGAEVLAKINQLNAEKTVHVNTVLLLASMKEKDRYKDFEKIMTQIATDSGGVYKKFYADDF